MSDTRRRMPRASRTMIVAIASAAALTATSQAAVAQADDCTDESTLGVEVVAYCETFDVTVDDALAQLEQQPEVHAAIDEAREIAGDRLVLAETEHDEFFGVHVVVTEGEELPALETYLDGLEVQATVDYEDVPSETEGEEITESLVAEGLDDIAAVQGVRYDGETGAIVVDASAPLDAATEASLAAVAEAEGATLDVQVAPGTGGDARVGGLDALFSTTWCTQGFSIVASDGTRRTTTAGHCPDSTWRYEAANGAHSNPVHFTGQRRTPTMDVQWGTTSIAPLPEFQGPTMTSSTRLTVTSTVDRADSLGDLVCHRGATTGYSCGTVTSITYRPMWENACLSLTCSATWVQVAGAQLACAGGDSGGPVFSGSAAYGFVKGAWYDGTGRGQCEWLVYMPQDALTGIGPAVHIALG